MSSTNEVQQAAVLPPLQVTYKDDPLVLKEAATEDYSLHVAPLTWRMGKVRLAMAWSSLFTAMFWLVTAGALSEIVGSRDVIIGLVLSVVAYGIINRVISAHAAKTGLTVALFSRGLFGYLGAPIAALLFGATAIYYAVFEVSVMALAFNSYFGGPSLKLWNLIVVAYMAPLAFGGVRRWLDKLNGLLLPFYVVGLAGAVVWAISANGYHNTWLTYRPAAVAVSGPGWWFVFTTLMGVWVMMMYTWDFARFGKPSDSRFAGWVTFGPVFYLLALLLNGLASLFLVHTVRTPGPLSEGAVVIALTSLMGVWGLLFIFITQTKINSANFYLASSNLESFFSRVFKIRLPRWFWSVCVGAIVYLVTLTNVLGFIANALQYQGVLIVGWVGIAVLHIALHRGDPARNEFRPGRVRLFNPAGLISWAGSALAGIALLVSGSAWGATWAAPITLVIAVGLYAILGRAIPLRWNVISRPADPRRDVEDAWAARLRCHHCTRAYVAFEMDRDPRAGYQPICAACASASATFYRAARADGQAHA